MKKSFMFVAVAAAGMLASCSSDSLTAGPDPNIEPTQEERVPIQLSVSSPSVNLPSGATRGTGTVGSVSTDLPNNLWYGQPINVFMFTKDGDHDNATTLTLTNEDGAGTAYYDNALMITPGTDANHTPGGTTPTSIGEAMLEDGAIKYYPHSGNYDFFGYHGDDAITGPVDKTTAATTLWTVPFTINGSQDLMSTKAAPLTWDELSAEQKAAFNDDDDAYTAFLADGDGDFYSAKAARKLIQPVLSFNHLLTRLTFKIKPGNDNAGGWIADQAAVLYANATEYNTDKGTSLDDDAFDALSVEDKTKTPAVAAHQDADKAVYVKSIEVLSKRTGKMAVAWTADDPGELITWDDDEPDPAVPANWLSLKERPAYYNNTDKTITISTALHALLPVNYAYCENNTDASVRISETDWAALPVADPGDGSDWQGNYTPYDGNYYLKKDDPSDRITDVEYGTLPVADPGDGSDWQGNYTKGYYQGNFNPVGTDVANNNLTTLTPDYPHMTESTATDPDQKTAIGEALIVAPSEDPYQMRVTLSQEVKTNWDGTTEVKNQEYELKIPAPAGGFVKNTSYEVILTVYGFERIEVITKIKPWTQDPNPLNVGGDDDE